MSSSADALVLVCQECPYPANHGGRVDMWRRLNALNQAGVPVHLVCWSDGPVSPEVDDALKSVCQSVHHLRYKRGPVWSLMKLLTFVRLPAPLVTRWVLPADVRELVSLWDTRRIAAVMQDGLMAGALASKLSGLLRVPLWVRSHNIEHHYWRAQLQRATGWVNRIKLQGRLFALERFEKACIAQAQHVFDISANDARFWREQGHRSVHWVPPVATLKPPCGPVASDKAPTQDIVFIGNLRMPNNVEGILWFVNQIKPRVDAALGRCTSVLVAGSGPCDLGLQGLPGRPGITMEVDFASLADVQAQAKVFINPMLSGSGVALKTVDMLITGKPVVATTQGVAGLGADIQALAVVADTPEAFAEALVVQLQSPLFRALQQQAVVAAFGPGAVAPIVQAMKGHLA